MGDNLGQQDTTMGGEGIVDPVTTDATETGSEQEVQTAQQTEDKDTTYTKEDVSRIIQARLAEEQRKYGDYDKLRALSSKLEHLTGRTADDLSQQLDIYYQQLEAQQSGLPPQAHQEINMAKQAAIQAYQQNLDLRLAIEEQNMKRDPVYADLKGELREAAYAYARRAGVSLTQAYWAVNGPAKAKQLEREIEQRILANQKHRDESGVVTGDSAEEAKSLGLTMEQIQAAKLLGMTPAEYAAFAKVDNLESYRKFKKDKKKK